ncbi:peptide chain release factor N(5)-glutamine methyltransferase [Afifella sp. IM 167]|uniref:peptide chain release factor N(5)-glutamine methyltransferase n=1 Tax=Afifella sp. IM 167 TaxID=2033586 RepID=UPI001CCD28AF|nr:peptide chain release factor N(5)-glutamine methyltransferase [Afifella sp. IM 167]
MTSRGEALDLARRLLAGAGVADPRRDARKLLAAALGIDDAELIARPETEIREDEEARFSLLVKRRAAREPVARILGETEFWGIALEVTADVLLPRPETEHVVEAALAWLGQRRDERLRLADLGTGSGAIAIALLCELPEAEAIGLDISAKALSVARRNAGRSGVSERFHPVQGDFSSLKGPFDIVVSNPPYIASGEIAGLMPEVRSHDPAQALDGGEDGLAAYRAIAARLPALLKTGGAAFLEVGEGQAEAVERLLGEARLAALPTVTDLAAIGRVVSGETKPASLSETGGGGFRIAKKALGKPD